MVELAVWPQWRSGRCSQPAVTGLQLLAFGRKAVEGLMAAKVVALKDCGMSADMPVENLLLEP